MSRLGLDDSNPMMQIRKQRLHGVLKNVEDRVKTATWLAGDEFTAADIMSVFTLTTMRLFMPIDLTPYPGIVAYLQRVGEREAYKTAMEKGDPGLVPVLGKEPPELFEPLRNLG